MGAVHSATRHPLTRLVVIAVSLVCLAGCAPRIVQGHATYNPAEAPGQQGAISESPQGQQPVSAPSRAQYPKTDHPSEHPGVGLGVLTHPPTDFSLIPAN